MNDSYQPCEEDDENIGKESISISDEEEDGGVCYSIELKVDDLKGPQLQQDDLLQQFNEEGVASSIDRNENFSLISDMKDDGCEDQDG